MSTLVDETRVVGSDAVSAVGRRSGRHPDRPSGVGGRQEVGLAGASHPGLPFHMMLLRMVTVVVPMLLLLMMMLLLLRVTRA